MARKKIREDNFVTLEFTKPTMNFAVGDIVSLSEEWIEEVLEEYVANYFGSDEERDRYKIVDPESAPAVKKEKRKEDNLKELQDEALELGIDISNLGTANKLKKAIAKVKDAEALEAEAE